MNHKKARAIMNYNLNTEDNMSTKKPGFSSLKSLVAHMVEEKKVLVIAFIAMVVTAMLNLAGPIIIGYTVDNYIQTGQFRGVLNYSILLLVMYIIAFGAGYLQTKLMGSVGQRMLFNLRNSVFGKLQELPFAFFNQNKTGDLISRINNDTDKINQFFSQSLNAVSAFHPADDWCRNISAFHTFATWGCNTFTGTADIVIHKDSIIVGK
jgi:ATP-binding cassette, subfamily B, bacterial